MELVTLFGISFVGTLLWFINSETAAAVYGSRLGWHWAAVGLTCAVAQSVMYVLLYQGGDVLVRRWTWFGAKIEAVRARYGEKLERRFIGVMAIGSVLGVPPAVAMPVLAPSFRVGMLVVLPIMFAGRFVRFSILAAFGEALLGRG